MAIVDDLAQQFASVVKQQVKSLPPGGVDVAAHRRVVNGGQVVRYRITSGLVTAVREVRLEDNETVQESSRKMVHAMLYVCREFVDKMKRRAA